MNLFSHIFFFLVVVVGWPEVLFGLLQYDSSLTYRKGNTLDSRTAVSTRVALFRLLIRKNWVNQGGSLVLIMNFFCRTTSFTLCEKPAPHGRGLGTLLKFPRGSNREIEWLNGP